MERFRQVSQVLACSAAGLGLPSIEIDSFHPPRIKKWAGAVISWHWEFVFVLFDLSDRITGVVAELQIVTMRTFVPGFANAAKARVRVVP